MKVRVIMLAVGLVLGMAMAQTATPDRQAQGTQPQTNPPGEMKSGTSGMQNSAPAEMKTMSFKGVLVDMACAGHASGSTPAAEDAAATAGAPPEKTGSEKTAGREKPSSANRSAGDSGPNCPVSASSTEMGMKLDDGRLVRFDLVGNQRATDEIKNNKHWNKDIADGKPVHAKISGVMNGDKLIVSSIH